MFLREGKVKIVHHPIGKQQKLVGGAESPKDFVCGHDDKFTFLVSDALEQGEEFTNSGKIKIIGGLVEQEYRRILRQSTSHHHALPLSVAQFSYLALCQTINATKCEGMLHDVAVLCLTPEVTRMRKTAKRHKFFHRQCHICDCGWQHQGHELCALL